MSEIYAPVAGEVVAVNPALADAPETLNRDPYGEGWICELIASDPTAVDGLLDSERPTGSSSTIDRSRWPTGLSGAPGWERLPWGACSAPTAATAIRQGSTSARRAAPRW